VYALGGKLFEDARLPAASLKLGNSQPQARNAIKYFLDSIYHIVVFDFFLAGFICRLSTSREIERGILFRRTPEGIDHGE
jgi:hypothetical protein